MTRRKVEQQMVEAVLPALREVLRTRVALGAFDYRKQIRLVLEGLYLQGQADAIEALRADMAGRQIQDAARRVKFGEKR